MEHTCYSKSEPQCNFKKFQPRARVSVMREFGSSAESVLGTLKPEGWQDEAPFFSLPHVSPPGLGLIHEGPWLPGEAVSWDPP